MTEQNKLRIAVSIVAVLGAIALIIAACLFTQAPYPSTDPEWYNTHGSVAAILGLVGFFAVGIPIAGLLTGDGES